ncbi:oligosaccharide flippase family protein [Rhodopila sp.]|uniref:oligosaccharide flippase family protein n=1 Tax=Rhodopila sp. TaxID=2480087 RepID=UPI002BC43DC5|nr:oligosaccharide flippase family protein [Rhodopila sp.]HVZ08229.1 oligosaccharide flippase family protein [Rhodopila sp.]
MRQGAYWSGLEAAVSGALSLLTSILVARIIGPSEMGIGASAVALHVVLWVVVNALFADAVVQRASIDQAVLSSAFWASVATGCAALILQMAGGWGLASLLDDSRLVPMGLVLAVPLPVVGAAGTVQGLLTRERAYRSLALRTLIGQGLGTCTGIVAAAAGAGAWAVVSQQAIVSLVGAVTLLIGRGWRPDWILRWTDVRPLLRVGLPLAASTIVLIARYRVFAVLIGGTAGATVLGQVHIAFRLVDTVRELVFTAMWRLMLPALSEHQNDRRSMLAQVDRWLRWAVSFMFPLCIILALILTEVVALLLGPDWVAGGQAAMPLVGLMAVSTLVFPSGVALVALGQTRFTLYSNIASLMLVCGGVLLVRPADPWHAVAVWTVSQMLILPYVMWVNARALGVPIVRPVSGGLIRADG